MTEYTRATQIADIARAFEEKGHLVTAIDYSIDGEMIVVYAGARQFTYCIGSDDDSMIFACSALPPESCIVQVIPSMEG